MIRKSARISQREKPYERPAACLAPPNLATASEMPDNPHDITMRPVQRSPPSVRPDAVSTLDGASTSTPASIARATPAAPAATAAPIPPVATARPATPAPPAASIPPAASVLPAVRDLPAAPALQAGAAPNVVGDPTATREDRLLLALARMSEQMDDMRQRFVTLEERVTHIQHTNPQHNGTSTSAAVHDNNTAPAAVPLPSTSAAAAAPPMPPTIAASSNSSSTPAAPRSEPARQSMAQLTLARKFELPEFCGLPEQWPTFIASFRQSTEALGYTELQNVFRLQKCLKGQARDAVEYLLIQPDNVEDIISVLQFQFGRPEILADSQTEKVLALPDIFEKHTEQLIVYAAKVQNMVAYLNNDDSRHVLEEQSTLRKLEAKLPPSKHYEWTQHARTIETRPTIVHFSSWLKHTAETVTLMRRQKTTTTAPSRPTPTAPTPSQPSRQRQPPRPHMLLATTTGRQCCICSRAHRVSECDQFRALSVPDRWEAARRRRLCFGCLNAGHAFDMCRSKRPCASNGCDYSHHGLLHETRANNVRDHNNVREANIEPAAAPAAVAQAAAPPNNGQAVAPNPNNPFNRPPGSAPAVYTCRVQMDDEPILYRIVPVRLFGASTHVDTFALFDEGSALTLIEDDTANRLQLTGPRSNLNMQWIGGRSSSDASREVSLHISGAGQHMQRYGMNNVRTIRNLNLPMQTLTLARDDPRHRHLQHLHVCEYSNATPTILIGLDHSHLGAPKQTRTSTCGGPIATRTRLGWVVYGRQTAGAMAPRIPNVLLCSKEDDTLAQLETLMREYLSVENAGVAISNRVFESDADARAREILRTTTARVGDRFEVGLLWRSDQTQLPDSYDMALRRLATIERKMRREPEYGALYAKHIATYLDKGYARKLPPEEAAVRDERTWYLPHFGVQPANKPGKFRLVFDAAAAVNGVSLNSELLKGPDLNQPLATILFRFRMRAVGVCADISEMFHQVMVRKEDRRAQRFLWRSNSSDKMPDEYEMLVMTFGATCSPTAAQFIKNHNADENEAEFPAAAEAFRSSHYVDDFVCSFTTVDEADRVSKDVVEVHRRGEFVLRGFVCNKPEVTRALDGASTHTIAHDMQLAPNASDKILGLMWRTDVDVFTFAMRFDRVDPDVVAGARPPTKREILSAVMSVFDPFGFLADVVLPAKVLVQDLWKAAVGWDEKVPPGIYERWRTWCHMIDAAKSVQIPRCYSENFTTSTDVELHMFADASEQAYAAVGYWRIGHGGRFDLAFVMGKTKCAPVKTLSIPRLELQAAVLAVRMLQTIRECHPVAIKRVVMWTDSRTVVQWIRSTTRRYKPYVAHRVAEVIEHTHVDSWRWLPTDQNVADDATRAKAATQLDVNSRWLRGPAFLLLGDDAWPTEIPTAGVEIDDNDPELIRERFVGAVQQCKLFDLTRFSNYCRLVRAMAWARRFVHNARAKRNKTSATSGELDATEIRCATELLCRQVQREAFAEELSALSSKQSISASSPVRTLLPYLCEEDELLRLFGRTDAADAAHLPTTARRPILLPKAHRFSELLVAHYHAQFGHQLDDAVICMVRQRYWIPSLRALLKKVKFGCGTCKVRRARPHPPVAGQLPPDRLAAYQHPFAYTGLDFFGPVAVAVGRRREKRWVALFTCLTTRAVHLEIAADLSTDACLLCIRNFFNLRGVPTRMRSDCGTNFVGADNEMRRTADFVDVDEMQKEMSSKGVQWLFNCPANPEAGGAWERLVQCTKRVLSATLKETAPRVETLRSVLIEAANIINSRPLTHIPVSAQDDMPLTPNHFLLGRANFTAVPGPVDARSLCSIKQWRIGEQLKNRFWAQFVRDYMPELTRRTRFYEDVPPLTVGDLVLVCETNQPRSQWVRGRVVSVVRGTDGRVRTAAIRTSSGVMRRPVTKLAVLDVVGEARDGRPTGPGMSPPRDV